MELLIQKEIPAQPKQKIPGFRVNMPNHKMMVRLLSKMKEIPEHSKSMQRLR